MNYETERAVASQRAYDDARVGRAIGGQTGANTKAKAFRDLREVIEQASASAAEARKIVDHLSSRLGIGFGLNEAKLASDEQREPVGEIDATLSAARSLAATVNTLRHTVNELESRL